MTREEAIEVLNTYDTSEDNDDAEFKGAIALAIKALEQEPKIDVLEQIREHFEAIAHFNGTVKADYVLRILDKAIKEVEQ